MSNPDQTGGWLKTADVWTVLDLIVAEFTSDPMSVQCFDLRIVDRAKTLVREHHEAQVLREQAEVAREQAENRRVWAAFEEGFALSKLGGPLEVAWKNSEARNS